jgi:hypothetical protein
MPEAPFFRVLWDFSCYVQSLYSLPYENIVFNDKVYWLLTFFQDQFSRCRIKWNSTLCQCCLHNATGRCSGRDHMVVVFTTTYAICAYHHWCCEFNFCLGRGVQYYVIKFVNDLLQVGGFLRKISYLMIKSIDC